MHDLYIIILLVHPYVRKEHMRRGSAMNLISILHKKLYTAFLNGKGKDKEVNTSVETQDTEFLWIVI